MLCQACKADIPADADFCPKCGQRLSAPASLVAASPAERLRAAQPGAAAPAEPETELWHGTYSPKAMYGSWALAALATIAGLILAVLVAAAWIPVIIVIPVLWLGLLGNLLVRRFSIEYTLTTQRLMHKSGLLRRVSNRVAVIDIDDVSFEQGLFERMFNVGTIKLLSSDVSDPMLILRGIEDVQRVANLIDDARREERRKRALYMETV